MRLNEMEYKGLDLLDEICTVKIAFDEEQDIIHVFDVNHVVEPDYLFSNKTYVLSDGFAKLAEVLKSKYFFVEKREMELAAWIRSFTWQFYSSNQTVKTYKKDEFTITPAAVLSSIEEAALIQMGLYPKYVERLG